ncbi:MAG: hypothetical protein HUU35_04260, partial [Armatimonadetes bacterium]|nr:hypothetical protein [Armatimonadota bacterium]
VYRLRGRKFVPWEALRSAVVSDLGSRAPWAALRSVVPPSRHGLFSHGHYLSCDDYREQFGPLPVRVLMILYTTRGLILIGPELANHGELVDRVRAHLDG